jgi:hypothetical protein
VQSGFIRGSQAKARRRPDGGYYVTVGYEKGNFTTPMGTESRLTERLHVVVMTASGQGFLAEIPECTGGCLMEADYPLAVSTPPGAGPPTKIHIVMETVASYDAGGTGPSISATLFTDLVGGNIYTYDLEPR